MGKGWVLTMVNKLVLGYYIHGVVSSHILGTIEGRKPRKGVKMTRKSLALALATLAVMVYLASPTVRGWVTLAVTGDFVGSRTMQVQEDDWRVGLVLDVRQTLAGCEGVVCE